MKLNSLRSLFMSTALALMAACGGTQDPATATAPPPVAPTISAQPADMTVVEGGVATFSVAADGTGPLAYEWRNAGDSSPVAGGVQATLLMPGVSLVDSGRAFRVDVSNAVGQVTSSTAALTVNERGWFVANRPQPGTEYATLRSGTGRAVAVEPDGIVHMLFTQEHADGSWHLWHARKSPNSSFAGNYADLTPGVAAGVVTSRPRLAINADGKLLALWEQFDPATQVTRIVWAAKAPGSAWQITGGSHDASGGALGPTQSATEAEVAVADSTAFEIIYRSDSGPNTSFNGLHQIRLTAAGGGSSGASGSMFHVIESPRIVSDGAGNLIAAWTAIDAFNQRSVWVSSQKNGTFGGWSQPLPASSGTDRSLTDLAINHNGQAVALWGDPNGFVFARQFSFAQATPGWVGGEEYAANGVAGRHAAVDVRDDGSITIVGTAGVPSGSTIYFWRYTMGSWASAGPQALETMGTGNSAVDLRIGHDANGNQTVLYSEITPAEASTLRARRYHAGLDQWRALATVAPVPAWGAELAVAANGAAGVVYRTEAPGPVLKLGVASFR